MDIIRRLAEEISAAPQQVDAAVSLLDGGATVPFVARYRKEATGGLDDIQLRLLEERLRYLRELETERGRVLASLAELGKLDPELEAQVKAADTKARLEDLYAPHRPKRRTLAMIAKENGLEPLAVALLSHPELAPEAQAAPFVVPEKVADLKAALDGARHILLEHFTEDADLIEGIRTWARENGLVTSKVVEGKEAAAARFRDWFNYQELWRTVPSHRALALFRGQAEELLRVGLEVPAPPEGPTEPERRIQARFRVFDQGRPGDKFLLDTVRLAWRARLSLRMEIDLLSTLRERAEADAIEVFRRNLRDLLLAAPAGPKVVLGLDPGIRTGVKVAVVDRTGRVIETATVYPFQPKNDVEGTLHVLERLCRTHAVELVSIGNGTAGRETDRLAAELISRLPEPKPIRVIVNEAGASVYSASEVGSEELPDLDVSLRGAASIARRLQDPLAELVKIDPKSIGVGQYQHDVNQHELVRALEAVVEDCVNGVGVDLNTASPSLLSRVAGLSDSIARNVVAWRDANGAFRNRKQLLDVTRLGPRTFEQCAGFLRIRSGDNPLDASGVHPESYPVVERILHHLGRPLDRVIGDSATLRGLSPEKFTDERFGVPTVRDILAELEKPGRDPRPAFHQAKLREGVEEISHLTLGMVLEGTVTNVTAFGAFVDLGVHQDGLVHVSRLSTRFVRDPHEVVKAGQVVTVKVMEVDLQRKRIALSMRLDDVPGAPPARQAQPDPRAQRPNGGPPPRNGPPAGPPQRPPERKAEPAKSQRGTLADLFPKR